MKYCSIIFVHYGLADDFGEKRAKSRGEVRTRSEMMRESLESLVENTIYPHELIVVDNGSPKDDTDYFVELTRKGKINTLIRNKNNMHFAFARNQALALATGDYICISDNDIKYTTGWLTWAVDILGKYPDRKLIATPHITPEKDNQKYMRGELDGNRLNSLAGSNCFVCTRQTMEDIGLFKHHQVGGTYWHRSMNKKGYVVVAPPKDIVSHISHKGGYNMYEEIKVVKVLSDGTMVDFTNKYGFNNAR
jgi:glycosyltransferase involved in cell wall biosynthesis